MESIGCRKKCISDGLCLVIFCVGSPRLPGWFKDQLDPESEYSIITLFFLACVSCSRHAVDSTICPNSKYHYIAKFVIHYCILGSVGVGPSPIDGSEWLWYFV